VVKDGFVYRPADLLGRVVGQIGPHGPEDHADWTLEVRALRN